MSKDKAYLIIRKDFFGEKTIMKPFGTSNARGYFNRYIEANDGDYVLKLYVKGGRCLKKVKRVSAATKAIMEKLRKETIVESYFAKFLPNAKGETIKIRLPLKTRVKRKGDDKICDN